MEIEIVQALWEVLTGPNVIYILLIIGLWAAASAFYVPGTGLLEALAVVCLVLAIAGLTQQPTNIVGLALIVAAGVLFLVDLKVQSVGLTLVAAVTMVLGSVFLFPPADAPCPGEAEAGRLSPWLIVGVTLLSLGFFGVTLSAVARAQRMKAKVSTAEVVGQRGRATTSLRPLGTVQVGSELWTAVSEDEFPIRAGDEIEVLAIDGLRLLVRRGDVSES